MHVGHRGWASELSHRTLPDSPWRMSASPYHASSVPRLPHPPNGEENAVSWTQSVPLQQHFAVHEIRMGVTTDLYIFTYFFLLP